MIAPVVRVAAWIAGAAAVLFAVYWAFLNTPESHPALLALSVLLAGLLIVAAALAVNTAVLLSLHTPLAASLRRAARGIPWFVAAALPAAAAIGAVLAGERWLETHEGEIRAWFIASAGWSDVSWLFAAARRVAAWARWVAVPAVAAALLAAWLTGGLRSPEGWRRLTAGWGWRLPAASACALLLVLLPWRAAQWRPASLPPTWVEPATAVIRLLLVGAVMAIGTAAALASAVGARRRP